MFVSLITVLQPSGKHQSGYGVVMCQRVTQGTATMPCRTWQYQAQGVGSPKLKLSSAQRCFRSIPVVLSFKPSFQSISGTGAKAIRPPSLWNLKTNLVWATVSYENRNRARDIDHYLFLSSTRLRLAFLPAAHQLCLTPLSPEAVRPPHEATNQPHSGTFRLAVVFQILATNAPTYYSIRQTAKGS